MKINFWKNRKNFKKTLKKILGFKPKNLNLYKIAFIHRSASYIDHKGNLINNERLEFLGDAILDAIIADYLFKLFPKAKEGFLTENRSKLVNSTTLFILAQKLSLEKLLIFKDIPNKKNICSDAIEALIGAVYLDKGYKKAYKFTIKLYEKYLDLKNTIRLEFNYKSRILEFCQKNHLSYEYRTEVFDQQENIFKSELFINEQKYGEGFGSTKKEAEQRASKQAFLKIKSDEKSKN